MNKRTIVDATFYITKKSNRRSIFLWIEMIISWIPQFCLSFHDKSRCGDLSLSSKINMMKSSIPHWLITIITLEVHSLPVKTPGQDELKLMWPLSDLQTGLSVFCFISFLSNQTCWARLWVLILLFFKCDLCVGSGLELCAFLSEHSLLTTSMIFMFFRKRV